MRKRKESILNHQSDRRKKAIDDRRKLQDTLNSTSIDEEQKMPSRDEQESISSQLQQFSFDQQNLNTYDKMSIDDKEEDDERTNSQKNKNKKNRGFFAKQLQIHDYLLKQDLEILSDDSFMIFARPEGDRCLVTSCQGKTVARNSQGYIQAIFQSCLPNGSTQQQDSQDGKLTHYNKTYSAALDCVFVERTKTFYIVDIIHWEDMIYAEFPFCSRLLFLQQRLNQLPQLNDQKWEYKFKMVEYMPCSSQSFLTAYYGSLLSKYVKIEPMIKDTQRYEVVVDDDAVLKELQNSQSELYLYYQALLKKVQIDKLMMLDQNKIHSNLHYAKDLMCKFIIDKDKELVFKDGIVIVHLESIYERGLNTLVLHWRDTANSIFNQSPYSNGMIDVILKINENYTFETFEGYFLKVKSDYDSDQLVSMKPGLLYHLQIKIDLQDIHQIGQNPNNQELVLVISDFRIKKKSSKIFADHLSKIIFKCLQANDVNLTPSEFITALEINSNEQQSDSTANYGVTPQSSADSANTKMFDIE